MIVGPRATEAQFQAAVIDLALLSGWTVHHTRPARTTTGWRTPITGHAGFPDLVLAHPDRGVIFAELKSATGRLSEDQGRWCTVLVAADVDYRLWRPSDWPTIVTTLTHR